jgi:hypothetical protein
MSGKGDAMAEPINNREHRIEQLKQIIKKLHAWAARPAGLFTRFPETAKAAATRVRRLPNSAPWPDATAAAVGFAGVRTYTGQPRL